ncbi:hypothetical protein [Methanosarcina sp.]|uniref:hypothetical protein n=1 Tax=Methanosarcina sp. TaxID=2213 RepID=UPI002C0A3CEE|nr:hypothetical protein [Methanosarcina sp.]HOW13510.1 hypothetical protein [Methanosarcina sp.]
MIGILTNIEFACVFIFFILPISLIAIYAIRDILRGILEVIGIIKPNSNEDDTPEEAWLEWEHRREIYANRMEYVSNEKKI